MTEPPDDQRLQDDLAVLAGLTAAGIEVDGEVQVFESTWVIYGHTTYDGEVIVGEYADAAEATAVLRALQAQADDQFHTLSMNEVRPT